MSTMTDRLPLPAAFYDLAASLRYAGEPTDSPFYANALVYAGHADAIINDRVVGDPQLLAAAVLTAYTQAARRLETLLAAADAPDEVEEYANAPMPDWWHEDEVAPPPPPAAGVVLRYATSRSNPGQVYILSADGKGGVNCNCPSGFYRRQCRHISEYC